MHLMPFERKRPHLSIAEVVVSLFPSLVKWSTGKGVPSFLRRRHKKLLSPFVH